MKSTGLNPLRQPAHLNSAVDRYSCLNVLRTCMLYSKSFILWCIMAVASACSTLRATELSDLRPSCCCYPFRTYSRVS